MKQQTSFAKRVLAGVMGSTMLLAISAAAVDATGYDAVAIDVAAGAQNGVAGNLDMSRISQFSIGMADEDGGMIEIVTYNPQAQVAYAVAGSAGQMVTIDMNSVTAAGLAGEGVDMAALTSSLDATFTYGDMSSIAVNAQGTKLAVALQAEGYNDDGRVAVFNLDAAGNLEGTPVLYTCGKQPDALTFTPDGNTVLVANEGEPRNGYVGAEDPEGSVTLIDVATGKTTPVAFDDSQADAYRAAGVLLMDNSTPSVDFEPEYIACDNTTAYIALQENNAIAVLDIASATITGVYGLGLQNYGEVAADLQDDGTINMTTTDNVYGIRMPDGISMATIGGTTYLFTANEGDGREWGEEDTDSFYCNEQKGTTSPTGNVEVAEKITWFNPADYTQVLDQDMAYMYGARSFSIFAVTENGLDLVFDSGSDFETITAELFPENFNCSNDDIIMEDRSGKKGVEPEYTITGEVDGRVYAFTGLERMGGVMAYDVTDPANATFVNYLNTRDYSADIAGDVAPEGMSFVSAQDSATGNALLLVANEVSGTMAVIELTTSTGAVLEEVAEEEVAEEVVVEEVVEEVTTPTAATYTIVEGDTLASIAAKLLGDNNLWSVLYQLNADVLAAADMIHPGQVIVLPM